MYLSRKLLIISALFCVILFGFNEYESDNLYSYQWGLKNQGNFFLDRGILAENHNILYHQKVFTDAVFFDDKSMVQYLKVAYPNQGIAYATDSFDINWEEGYKLFKQKNNKRNVVVAIIDSGIDISHYELNDNIWVNEDEIPDNGVDDDNNGYIDDRYGYNFYDKNSKVFVDANIDIHGTHAAGTVVAKHNNGGVRGIAYDDHVKVMSLKILGENGKGSMSSLIEAINYAKRNGANICNISLGAYTYDANLDNAIKRNPDMLFVVAAGNGANFIGYSLDERNVYPAKLEYDNVITVSNACFDGERYVSANYGTPVDVFAPGTFILSTAPNNNFGYFTGTSMAAPFVTATCAMIYSAYERVPLSSYKSVLINSVSPNQKFFGLGKGAGLLNIYNALMLASTF